MNRWPSSTILRKMAEEEREEERSDVLAVHVGVRHDDDAVVAELGGVEFRIDAGAERGDQDADLLGRRASCPRARAPCSGSFRAGEGWPESGGRAPVWPSRRPNRPPRCTTRRARRPSRSNRRACQGGRRCRGPPCAAPTLWRGARPRGRAPRRSPSRRCGGRCPGFSSRCSPNFSLTIVSTRPLMSGLFSRPLVCPSNCGLARRTLMTAVRPSRTSSPLRLAFRSFRRLRPAGVVVDGARQRRSKPDDVGAAVVGVDVVGEGEYGLCVAVVVLEGDLHRRCRRAALR